ncbi:MAG TPA: lipoprotein [Geminicoccaceae bacterium]|nr:lipoprotein [Geminicoccus sp.]HMU50202.1 lipoprotein [Geminicoccaceae bacterium]
MTRPHDSEADRVSAPGRRTLATLLLAAALAGCGRKGALYMPGEEEDARRLPRTPPGSGQAPTETETLPDVEEDD